MTKLCTEEHEFYKPLMQASKYVVGMPENENIHSDNESTAYRLFSMTYHARDNWDVDECKNSSDELLVNIGDFIEWSWECGFKIQENIIDENRDVLSDAFLSDFRLSLIENKITDLKKMVCTDVSDEKWRDEKVELLKKEKETILVKRKRLKEKGKPILDRRIEVLREWLEELEIPNAEWLELEGYSRKEISDILFKRCPEVFSKSGDRISKSTFNDNFWKKQVICKLKERKL